MDRFKLHSPYKPTDDQPDAIKRLSAGVDAGMKHQTLLGVSRILPRKCGGIFRVIIQDVY